MTVEQQVARSKKSLQTLEGELNKAKGAKEAALERMSADFDVETVEQAEALLTTLRHSIQELEDKRNRAVEAFEEKWGEALNE